MKKLIKIIFGLISTILVIAIILVGVLVFSLMDNKDKTPTQVKETEYVSADFMSKKMYQSIKKINDDEEMKCVHYFNQIGKQYFDFAKGTNRYKNVYVMKGEGDMYDVTFTDKELNLITDIMKEDPKAIGTVLR